jgi:hypothetical protein
MKSGSSSVLPEQRKTEHEHQEVRGGKRALTK